MTRILVIEDEAILRDEVTEWMNLEGYEAISAEDGLAGVEQAIQYQPDLIICDITMPRLDGYGVLLEVHANPATANIPFIFVTARATHEDIRQGMAFGADDYIAKPFTRLELLQAVESRLNKKTAQEEKYRRGVEQLEEALAQEREQRLFKTRMVAMFSHDFRNPLSSILSSNALLRDYADRVDEHRRMIYHRRIESSVHQLMQMLEDMLLLAQMDTGHLSFDPEPVDVGRFFEAVVDEFQSVHEETHRLLFENSADQSIMADPRLLRQIAANLISNAIKYSDSGTDIRIVLEVERGQCVLKVQDQGMGIPEKDQQRLFNVFQRGSNVGKVSGTGLGLAIVKQAVDLHSGFVQVDSRVGAGTTVTVMIPAG